MDRPRKIIEHADDPATWTTEWPGLHGREALYLRGGSLWKWHPCGCVLCSTGRDSRSLTFESVDDSRFVCTTHGPLDLVKIILKLNVVATMEGVTNSGSLDWGEMLMLPQSLAPEERRLVIANLTKEYVKYQIKDDEEDDD